MIDGHFGEVDLRLWTRGPRRCGATLLLVFEMCLAWHGLLNLPVEGVTSEEWIELLLFHFLRLKLLIT